MTFRLHRGQHGEHEAATGVVCFAPDPVVEKWITQELAGLPVSRFPARSFDEVVSILSLRPVESQILVFDIDEMRPADLAQLHALRQQGWDGTIIVIGDIEDASRTSLNIDRVLRRPLGSEALRKAVTAVGQERATTKMPKLERPT